MEIELMNTFVFLAQYKNFSKTAEVQHIVQSTVTARIQELERIVGKQMFHRNKQKVELSEAGKLFLPFAQRILLLHEEGIRKVNSTDFFEGHIVVASVDSIWRYQLLPVLEKYMLEYPKVAIKSSIGHSAEVLQYLMDGIADIGFIYELPRTFRLEVIEILEDEFVLVAAPEHPLAKQKGIHVDQLPEIKLLQSFWAGEFGEWLKVVLSPNHVFQLQMDSTSMLLSLVKRGLGPSRSSLGARWRKSYATKSWSRFPCWERHDRPLERYMQFFPSTKETIPT